MKGVPRMPRNIPEIGRTGTLTIGARKALKGFLKTYGNKEDAVRIFLAKADEKGTGTTLRQKVNSIYHTGAKVPK